MTCPRCRTDNREGSRFCSACGAALDAACPACGFAVEPGSRFCGGCGRPLGAAPGVSARLTSPDAYTPRHIAERIRTTRPAVEGERKQVTVLFADMKGSLELLADRDPEEARALLDPVLELMMEAVHRYEGTVNQVLGDGIMAIFGAPIAHENHAVRAAYAALRMQDGVARMAATLRRSHGVDVQIRVGLNSGEVVVRSIGNDLHMDYTAVGQTTHLAARMEKLARPGTILVSGETHRLTQGYLTARPLGPVPVPGLPEPVEVFEATGAGPARSRLQAAAVRGLTRFVGRDAELASLEHALARARAGRGGLVALVGEPGVGKSRLVREISQTPRARDWTVLEGRPVVYRKSTAWIPVLEMLRAYFHLEPDDEPAAARDKVTARLAALDPTLTAMRSPLLALLELPVADPPWEAMEPPQRRRHILEALKSLLLLESRRGPLLLVFEDLHRVDEETQAFLDGLVDRLADARLLVLVTYRPEYQHGWTNKPGYTQLRLDPLGEAPARQLVDVLLGPDPSLDPLRALLIERTEGNPLFLEESVRALAETEVLAGERGAYRLPGPLTAVPPPTSVHAVLAARIDRLDPTAKHLLQCAAVVGRDVPFAVLQAVADLSPDVLGLGLARLQTAEFLHETRLFPEREHTFKHALIQEVAYASLLHDNRRALHARIVEAIEGQYAGRTVEQVERLGHHALRGGLDDRAVTYLRQAGLKAATRSAHRDAVTFFEQAIETVDRQPPTPERLALGVDLRFEARASLAALGDFARNLEHLCRAQALAESAGDEWRLGWTSAYLAQSHYTLGDQAAAIVAATRARDIAERLGDRPMRVVAIAGLGQAYHVLGEYSRSRALFEDALGDLEGELARERFGMAGLVSVATRVWLVNSLVGMGDFEAAVARAREAMRLAEPTDHPWSVAAAHVALGFAHLTRGDLEAARSVLERGLGRARDLNITAWLPMLSCQLGLVYARQGRVAEGLTLLEDGVQRAVALAIRSRHALRLAWLAEALLRAGRLEEARDAALRALDAARTHGERGYEGWALRMLGEVALAAGETTTAVEYYRAALDVADRLGMRALDAHTWRGMGRAAAAAGDATAAEAMAARADRRFANLRIAPPPA
ncbi:MAG TPA: AAA family ATPase [Verrucomicrobiae bacterium]|nr:AAA family ATPase [Verrucomicrobiae bacterium]